METGQIADAMEKRLKTWKRERLLWQQQQQQHPSTFFTLPQRLHRECLQHSFFTRTNSTAIVVNVHVY
jgi:hypothetical protein